MGFTGDDGRASSIMLLKIEIEIECLLTTRNIAPGKKFDE
jgi:hypothetical protein